MGTLIQALLHKAESAYSTYLALNNAASNAYDDLELFLADFSSACQGLSSGQVRELLEKFEAFASERDRATEAEGHFVQTVRSLAVEVRAQCVAP